MLLVLYQCFTSVSLSVSTVIYQYFTSSLFSVFIFYLILSQFIGDWGWHADPSFTRFRWRQVKSFWDMSLNSLPSLHRWLAQADLSRNYSCFIIYQFLFISTTWPKLTDFSVMLVMVYRIHIVIKLVNLLRGDWRPWSDSGALLYILFTTCKIETKLSKPKPQLNIGMVVGFLHDNHFTHLPHPPPHQELKE